MFSVEGKNLGHHIIELNGKQYDAKTGALLGVSRIKATPKTIGAAQPRRQGRVIDGFIAPARRPQGMMLAPAVAKPALPKLVSVRGGNVNSTKAHTPERSKTLMRHVVPKPQKHLKTAIKVSTPTEIMARPKSDLAKPLEKKLSVGNVDPLRLGKAKRINQSHHIQHFARTKQTAPALPATTTTPHDAPRHAQPISQLASQIKKNDTTVTTQDIFEAAIMNATSHQQPKLKAKRSRGRSKLVSALAAVAAFLVIGGFVAYLNAPKIELRVASMRAGFAIAAPNVAPDGFALNKIQSEKGQAVLSFNFGDRSYNIKQEVSDLNSQSLLDQYTFTKGAPTQTIQNNGRTIYLYGNKEATWVSGGIHYDVSGDLSDIDLSNLISNM